MTERSQILPLPIKGEGGMLPRRQQSCVRSGVALIAARDTQLRTSLEQKACELAPDGPLQ